MTSVFAVSGVLLAQVDVYWHLLPLVVLISLVYSAARYDQWSLIFKEAFRWGLRLTGFLFIIILALYLVSTVVGA